MKQLEYQLRFLTPAFLGDAEQSARWRTPPIKALLRQWWRVAWAAGNGFPHGADAVERMRREEGLLFGHAWLENDTFERDGREIKTAARKSLVRLRLDSWGPGSLEKAQWPGDRSVTHPEVKNRQGQAVPVGSALYLGYGPLTYDNQRRATTLKANAAIQAGESATFAIVFPTTHKRPELKALVEANAPRLQRALWLMDRFGTLGGRSRNGWGSFALTPLSPAEESAESATLPLRAWRDCLDRDWPHAVGLGDDGKPLIWQTAPHDDWQSLMKTLAVVKIGLRTQFVFPGVKPPHAGIEPRHWLSYPITNHTTSAWDRGARLPNQLRFRIRQLDDGKLVGTIFHVPHLPPPAFRPDRAAIERTWAQSHALLDHLGRGSPRTYPMIPEVAPTHRRSALQPHLDSVALERIAE